MRRMCWVILGLSLSLWSIDKASAASYVQIEQREFLQVVRGVERLKQENRLFSQYKNEVEKLKAEQMQLIEDMQKSLDFCEQQMKSDGELQERQLEIIGELERRRDVWRYAALTEAGVIFVLLFVGAVLY
jgi:uncharacterized protein HemX